MTKGKKWRMIIAGLVVLGLLCYAGLMTAVFISGRTPRPANKSDAIVVLGARVMPDGELSTTLLRRVETAYEAYDAGFGDYLIVCGAQGEDEPVTEAFAMREALIRMGVPEDRVILEDQSYNTEENLGNARKIMDERGMKTALVITSDYHLQRSLWLAKDAGLVAEGMAAPGPDLWQNRIKGRAREALAWVDYWLAQWKI